MVSIPLRFAGKAAGYVILTATGIVVEKLAEEKWKAFSEYAKEHGGYRTAATNVLRVADIETRRAVFHARRSLDERLQSAIEAARKKGSRLYGDVSDALNNCREIANDAYYSYYPRPEELAEGGKYQGVGIARRNTFLTRLSRDDCENCLGFIDRAKTRIPDDHPLKKRVINDIRRSGSYDAKVLERFYQDIFSWQFSDTIKLRVLMDCVQLASDFLKEPGVTLVGEKFESREG